MQAGKMGDPRVKMTVMSKKGRQFLRTDIADTQTVIGND